MDIGRILIGEMAAGLKDLKARAKLPLERGLTGTVVVAKIERAGRKNKQASTLLQEAKDLAERCGATGLLRDADTMLFTL